MHARCSARVFMNLPQEHLFKGIGWYFYNGAMIESRSEDLLLVGRLEHLNHDFNVLTSRLGIEAQSEETSKTTHLRKADSTKNVF